MPLATGGFAQIFDNLGRGALGGAQIFDFPQEAMPAATSTASTRPAAGSDASAYFYGE